MIPGEYKLNSTDIIINEHRTTLNIKVKNLGDKPIQIGSHYHFFEVNPNLEFERNVTIGYHLDIPSGNAVRFEPGDERTVDLVAYAGKKFIYGFHNAINDYIK